MAPPTLMNQHDHCTPTVASVSSVPFPSRVSPVASPAPEGAVGQRPRDAGPTHDERAAPSSAIGSIFDETEDVWGHAAVFSFGARTSAAPTAESSRLQPQEMADLFPHTGTSGGGAPSILVPSKLNPDSPAFQFNPRARTFTASSSNSASSSAPGNRTSVASASSSVLSGMSASESPSPWGSPPVGESVEPATPPNEQLEVSWMSSRGEPRIFGSGAVETSGLTAGAEEGSHLRWRSRECADGRPTYREPEDGFPYGEFSEWQKSAPIPAASLGSQGVAVGADRDLVPLVTGSSSDAAAFEVVPQSSAHYEHQRQSSLYSSDGGKDGSGLSPVIGIAGSDEAGEGPPAVPTAIPFQQHAPKPQHQGLMDAAARKPGLRHSAGLAAPFVPRSTSFAGHLPQPTPLLPPTTTYCGPIHPAMGSMCPAETSPYIQAYAQLQQAENDLAKEFASFSARAEAFRRGSAPAFLAAGLSAPCPSMSLGVAVEHPFVACYGMPPELAAANPGLAEAYARAVAMKGALGFSACAAVIVPSPGPGRVAQSVSVSKAGAGSGGAGKAGPSALNKKTGLYKTELCRSWEEKGGCRYGAKCQFAHGKEELRTIPRHPKFKTEVCKTFWESGSCPYGKRCCFQHTTASDGVTPTTSTNAPPARDPRDPPVSRLAQRISSLSCTPPASVTKEAPTASFGASLSNYLSTGESPHPKTGAHSHAPPLPPCAARHEEAKHGMEGTRIAMGSKFGPRDQVPGVEAPQPKSRLERLARGSASAEASLPLPLPLPLPTPTLAIGPGLVTFTNPFAPSGGSPLTSPDRAGTYLPPAAPSPPAPLHPSPFDAPAKPGVAPGHGIWPHLKDARRALDMPPLRSVPVLFQ